MKIKTVNEFGDKVIFNTGELNDRQKRFNTRHTAKHQAIWIGNAVLVAIVLVLMYYVFNAALDAIDKRVCRNASHAQYTELQCEDLIK